jgi:hypothetical protein
MTDTTRGGTAARTTSDEHTTSGSQRASAAAHDAGDRARDLTETGREEAGRIADEVKTQTSHLVGETRHRAKDRVDSQVDHVASMLGDMSGDLDRMADQTESPLGSLARDGATALRSVSHRLEHDGLDGVMGEVRQFARRRPMAFVAGAFAMGLVAGRLVRNTDVGAVADGARGHDAAQHDAGPRRSPGTPQRTAPGLGAYESETAGAFAGSSRGASSADVRASERSMPSGAGTRGNAGGGPR